MNIAALFFGLIALVLYVITLLSNNKKKILILLILSNTFYGLQYLMLSAYSGLYVGIIAILRTLVYLKYEKAKKKVDTFTVAIFVGLTAFGGVLSYNGIISLLPIIGTCIHTIYLSGKNIRKFKYACLTNSITWLIYNTYVKAYMGIISTIIEIIAVIYSISKLKKSSKF